MEVVMKTNVVTKQLVSGGSKRTIGVEFADLLIGFRASDEARQVDAYNALMRIARSIVVRAGFLAHIHSGDWEDIAHDYIMAELDRYKELTASEIVKRCEDREFAYLGKTLRWRFIDGLRTIGRRKEQLSEDWSDDGTFLDPQSKTNCGIRQLRSPTNCIHIRKQESDWDRQSVAKQLYQSAKLLPFGPGTILEVVARLMNNPDELEEFSDLNQTSTASTTQLAEHIAKSRGVGIQVVRKHMRQFKEHSTEHEYASVRNLLREGVAPEWKPPTITAPRTVVPVIGDDPSLALGNQDTTSRTLRGKCVICDARLGDDGDFCATCVREDEERKFQRFIATSFGDTI
jgi:hypothetical protein